MEITTCDIVEMLKSGITGEKQAVTRYQQLADLSLTTEQKQEINSIRKQEMRHYDILQEIYEDITGREYTPETVRESMPANWCEGLKAAICDELKAAEEYSELACCLICMRHKEKIISIINDEKCHAKILYSFYEEC